MLVAYHSTGGSMRIAVDEPYLARWPPERAAREDVGMHVEDALPDLGTGVEDRPERLDPRVGGEGPDACDEPASLRRVTAQVEEIDEVQPRNDKHMCWRLRIEVLEDHDVVVLIHRPRGDRTSHDHAEQALIGHDWQATEILLPKPTTGAATAA